MLRVNGITHSPSGDHIFAGVGVTTKERKFGAVKIWDSSTMEEEATLKVSEGSVYGIEFSPDGRYLATGAADSLASIWDASEMVCLRTCTSLTTLVRSIAFSGDSKYLSYGGEGHAIYIADAKTGETVHAVPVPLGGFCQSLAWHHKQSILAYTTMVEGSFVNGKSQSSAASIGLCKVPSL